MAYDAVRAGSLQMGLLVVAPVHTDRQAAGRSGHLDVVGGVADHHRHRRIDPDLGHGHLQQMGMRLAGPVVSRLEIMEARRQAVALQHSEEAAPVLAGGDTEEDLGVDQGIEHLEGAGKQRLVMLRSGLQGEEGGAVVLDEMERARSEEHKSALQSLMRISYAVFCLKKKNNKKYL